MGGKILLSSITLLVLFAFMPTIGMAASNACDGVLLDNDTSDWADVDALISDPGTTTGITYFWDGTQWLTAEPPAYDYSTNVDQMADLENIKMCNDMKAMYLYVDAQHPMFGIFSVADQIFQEYPDPETLNIGMPQAFDYWMVYQMQKQGSDSIYHYGIHLVSDLGDAGLESGPTKQALYEDDGDGTFNPNLDTELAEFEDNNADLYEGSDTSKGKSFDQEGGLEVGLYLVNADGEGLFTSTDISYGDTMNVSVAMYPSSSFTAATATTQSVEQTENFEYKIAKVGVQNVRVPKKLKKKKKVTVKWDSISVASKYIGKLYLGKKYKRTFKTTKVKKVLKNLKYNKKKKYKVKLQAKISTVKTPYSSTKSFRTKK